MTPAEHQRVVAATVAAAAGRVPVIAGAGSNNTQDGGRAARVGRAGGRAGVALRHALLPEADPGRADRSTSQAIHDAVGIPVILYDVPSRTACPIADVTITRLAELPRIVGLKDATGDIAPGEATCAAASAIRFRLLSGDDATPGGVPPGRGDGCISVTANVAPALCAALQQGL